MNKKKVVSISQQQYTSPNIAQISLAAVIAKRTTNIRGDSKRGGSSFEHLSQIDAIGALTTSSVVGLKRALVLTNKLRFIKPKTRRKNNSSNQSINFHNPDINLGRNGSPTRTKTLSCSSKYMKTFSLQGLILMLLCLLSLNTVIFIIHKRELLVGAFKLPNISISNANHVASRLIRSPELLTDELNNEILVKTAKHGFFKGRFLSSNNLPSIGLTSKASDSRDASVIGFLGIRYASAPVKRLRFMPPTAYHYAPNQVHDMQHFGPICRQRFPIEFNYSAQSSTGGYEYETARATQQRQSNNMLDHDLFGESTSSASNLLNSLDLQMRLMRKMMPRESFNYLLPLFRKLAAREQSEDCLNLNIYVPKEALTNAPGLNRPRPVLVIIHGESFDYGAGSTINGLKFVQQTRLITITFNYRLNILGFPPKLAGASRGNLGLMDQVAALHWIRDNIGSFGGSPNNITLMGTKRGAIFVNLLMLSPLAKGLFQRAIMEDGSALTPIVANHIISPTTQPPAGNLNQLSSGSLSFPAIQHVRFLAKLCDCPVYQRVTKLPTTNSNNNNLANSSSAFNMASGSSSSTLVSMDEIKANALTFECLRHKPIEQIMQPVPLDLLQFNQAGELTISSRWLKSANFFTTTPTSATSQAQVDFSTEESQNSFVVQSSSSTSGDELTLVDSGIINKLVMASIKEQIERDRTVLKSHENSTDGMMQVSELFNALYAPPSSSVRPLFGPVEDGTIVPEEDIAGGMLKAGSTFAQRDLLIGLSQPVISSTTEKSHDDKMDQLHSQSFFEFGSDNILADRITAQIQQSGLSNEQAVSLVNVFVRSFYRYHNQEITNSIINHYLSSGRVGIARKLKNLQTDLRGESESKEESKISEQQLFVLNSLLEAFQDALINVPVLKTGLIHAIKQLEPLAEAFVGQQFERWKQSEQPSSNHDVSSSQYEYNQTNKLQESFILFAQSLYNDTNWPLELHSPSNTPVQQPKSTYLYQYDSFATIRRIQKLISQLVVKSSTSFGWKNVKANLELLLMKLQDIGLRRRMGFECIMQLNSDGDNNISDSDESGQYIVQIFNDLLCSKYATILSGFVATGKMSSPDEMKNEERHLLQDGEDANNWKAAPMSERIARFDSECLNYKKQPSTADHHSVQLTGTENQSISVNGSCRRELNNMVLDYLVSEFDTPIDSSDVESHKWTVFNIFNQHIATLPAQKDLWHVGPISDDDLSAQYDQKSTFSARSSFWANFVPALNCTKTQPIIPISLLSSSLASSNINSSLLNLNILFNCQHGGRTSYETFESLISSMKQQLQAKILQWKLGRASLLAGQQNHHSLRMANIGQTNSPDENLDSQEHLSSEAGSRFNLTNDLPSGFIEANNGDSQNINNSHSVVEMRTKYVGIVLIFCAIVVSATLASGACAVIRQRKQNRDQEEKKRKAQISLDVRSPQPENQQLEMLDSIDQQESTLPSSELEVLATMNNQPVLEDDRELIAPDQNQSMNYNLRESPSVQLNHICTLDNKNGYLYWNDGQQVILDGSVALCRSHSSLNVPNNGNLITDTSTAQNHLTQSQMEQEPIMMPILTSSSQGIIAHPCQSQTSSLRRAGCLSNSSVINGFHGDSSSDAQDQSRLSTSKKRVKISDPPGTARRTPKASEINSNRRLSSRGADGQLRLNDPIFCPVHRDQAVSTMAQADAGGYYLDGEQAFISTNGPWNGNQIEIASSNQYLPNLDINNCDQYDNSNPQHLISHNNHQDYKSISHNNLNSSSNCNSSTMDDAYRTTLNYYHSSNYHQQ